MFDSRIHQQITSVGRIKFMVTEFQVKKVRNRVKPPRMQSYLQVNR